VNHEHHRAQLLVCWLAVLLVSGEFAWALVDFWREGRSLAIYLFFDTLIRETHAGSRYQEMFLTGVRRMIEHCRRLPGPTPESLPATVATSSETDPEPPHA
jgi:hypothetical protein